MTLMSFFITNIALIVLPSIVVNAIAKPTGNHSEARLAKS